MFFNSFYIIFLIRENYTLIFKELKNSRKGNEYPPGTRNPKISPRITKFRTKWRVLIKIKLRRASVLLSQYVQALLSLRFSEQHRRIYFIIVGDSSGDFKNLQRETENFDVRRQKLQVAWKPIQRLSFFCFFIVVSNTWMLIRAIRLNRREFELL